MAIDKKKSVVPGIQVGLDPYHYPLPPGTDTIAAIERLALENKKLEELRESNKARGQFLDAPLSEKSIEELNYGHKLVALLIYSGASTLDIAQELGSTAQNIELFESNRLIRQQIEIYKTRFQLTDTNSKLKEMLDPGLKLLKDVIMGSTQIDEAKRVDTIKWLIEKLTGKPAQQIDVNQNVNFGNILDEMKKMRESRSLSNQADSVIDVTPGPTASEIKKSTYEKWLSDFHKKKELQT
jgi:hypothetical protein